MSSYSNFGLINSVGYNIRPGGGDDPGAYYTPANSGEISSFFISSYLTNITKDGSDKISQVDATLGSGALSQATYADQPYISETELNGYKVFRMDGGSMQFDSNVNFPLQSGTGDRTIGILAKIDSDASGALDVGGQWKTGQLRWLLTAGVSAQPRMYIGTQYGTFDQQASGITTTDWNVYWIVFNTGLSTPCQFYMNGASTPVGAITYSNATSPDNVCIGGRNNAGSNGWDGQIASVCIWSDNLSTAERQSEISNINSFWGLSI